MSYLLVSLMLLPALAVAAPPRILILTGDSDLQYHDWRQTAPFLRQLLAAHGCDVRIEEEPRGITRETLATYDAVLVNYNGPRWGAAAEAAVADFVRGGKGLVSLHNTTYGPFMGTVQQPGKGWVKIDPWAAWSEMLGAWWAPVNIGHAPRGAFTVKLAPGHPITAGAAPEFTVNDELYHKIEVRPDATIVARAYDDAARGGTGNDEPIAWTHSYGRGRVFYTALGHDVNALYQPAVEMLLARAAEWTATASVAPAARMAAKPHVRALVVTGGHDYPPSFYSIFESFANVRWTHAASQKEAFTARLKGFDVVVLYDMANDLTESQRTHLRAFVEAGKGVVALHHSIIDYTNWPWWWQEVIGGKYFEKPLDDHTASHYKEGVPMLVRSVKGQERHPILRGVGDLVTDDECYRGLWHSPAITVLMETENELNDRPVVWLGPRPGSRVVYIQLGHGEFTHRHPGYRTLLHNAIAWAAGK